MLVGREDKRLPRREVVEQAAARQPGFGRNGVEGDSGNAVTLDNGDDRVEDFPAIAGPRDALRELVG